MGEIVCTGFDGANPLHMLAGLGLLRLLDRDGHAPRLSWVRQDGAYRPVFHASLSMEDAASRCALWLNALALTGKVDPDQAKAVKDLGATLKKKDEALKKRKKAVNDELKGDGPVEVRQAEDKKKAKEEYRKRALQPLEDDLVSCRERLRLAQESKASALGDGIAHLGDIIGMAPGIARGSMERARDAWLAGKGTGREPSTADPALVAGQLAALCSDAVTDEGGHVVQYTPFSFGNGAGGQCLLKDFRNCAAAITKDRALATLSGNAKGRIAEGMTGLNWDPADQRSYALDWCRPEDNPKQTDVAANALAYVGLSLLPAVPSRRGLRAIGWDGNRSWSWPLWEPVLSLPVVMSLLASPLDDLDGLRRMGVLEVRRSERINPTGRRSYFAPSRPA